MVGFYHLDINYFEKEREYKEIDDICLLRPEIDDFRLPGTLKILGSSPF